MGNPTPGHHGASLRDHIRQHARQLGFAEAGFTTADPLAEADQQRWRRWRAEDKAGAMRYLMRDRPRRTHPRDLLPEARTALVVMAAYYDGDHAEKHDSADAPRARHKIARFAWGRDYHLVMRDRLDELARWIECEAPGCGFTEPLLWRVCVDSAPLDERALARRAGLGFVGKNTLLLHPTHGSFSLLGVLLLSIELPPDEGPRIDPTATCGSCRRCLDACPTRAFDDAYRLDPRRCISYLTIEQKDPIPAGQARKLEDWIFGCDICQEVCPFNERPLRRVIPELAADAGAGPWLDEAEMDAIPSGKAFARRFAETPLLRAGLKGIRRVLAALRANGKT